MGLAQGKTPIFGNKVLYAGDQRLSGDDFVTTYPSASGGTETTDGDFRIHTFTSTGSATFTVHSTGSVNIFEVLMVAGGGGGGSRAGGGGGGGGIVYLPKSYEFSFPLPQDYQVTVGDGGEGAVDGVDGRGETGGDTTITGSSFTTITAKGGGGGGGFPYNSDGDGGDGGSGGGGQSFSSTNIGEGIQPDQSGDSGLFGFGHDGAPASTGGGEGGGGGGAGFAPYGSPGDASHKNGGDGIMVAISGTPTYYAGGGGGADQCGGTAGLGGLGGGKNGAGCSSDQTPAPSNLGGGGGGGGGGYRDGGKGGSGIVIIKYRYQ